MVDPFLEELKVAAGASLIPEAMFLKVGNQRNASDALQLDLAKAAQGAAVYFETMLTEYPTPASALKRDRT